jgi:hypothetical protein
MLTSGAVVSVVRVARLLVGVSSRGSCRGPRTRANPLLTLGPHARKVIGLMLPAQPV